jgi:hypothetical protein
LILTFRLSPYKSVRRLLAREDFISWFSSMSCHLKYFEIANGTTPKMHDFILDFNNIKFYFVSLVVYGMK